jgi:hypothetical protein
MVAPASRIHRIRNGMRQLNTLSPSSAISSRTQWISGNAVRMRPMTSFKPSSFSSLYSNPAQLLTVRADSLKISFRPTDASEANRRFKSHTVGSPPIKHSIALDAETTRFWVAPRAWGKKKEKFRLCLTLSYLFVKWNSFGLKFARPRFPTLEHGLSCVGRSRTPIARIPRPAHRP